MRRLGAEGELPFVRVKPLATKRRKMPGQKRPIKTATRRRPPRTPLTILPMQLLPQASDSKLPVDSGDEGDGGETSECGKEGGGGEASECGKEGGGGEASERGNGCDGGRDGDEGGGRGANRSRPAACRAATVGGGPREAGQLARTYGVHDIVDATVCGILLKHWRVSTRGQEQFNEPHSIFP